MNFTRIAGCGGLVFGITVTIGNILLAGAGKPLGASELSEIVAYYEAHGHEARRLTYLVPIVWPAIVLFAAGVFVFTRGPDGHGNGWALAGMMGIATMIPTFCGVVTADAVLATRASTLAADPQYTRMLWDFHMVLEILNLTFVAIALGGFGMAAITSGTAPRLGRLALPGAAFLLAGATQSASGLEGSRFVLVALPGFLIWLVFVIGYSVTMIRAGESTNLAAAAT